MVFLIFLGCIDYRCGLILDIQEFYDNTLLNEKVSFSQKTAETRRLAERWENNPPFGSTSAAASSGIGSRPFSSSLLNNHIREPSREASGFEFKRNDFSFELISIYKRYVALFSLLTKTNLVVRPRRAWSLYKWRRL